jgi:hypothetical protein
VFDATFVDWGGADGPFPAGQPPLVCGTVSVDPWIAESTEVHGLFDVKNCDGSTTPDARLASAENGFDSRIAEDQVQCADGFQDFCTALRTAESCLGAAMGLAQANFPVPVDKQSTATAFGNQIVDSGSSYLQRSATVVVRDIGHVTAAVGGILNVVGVIASLADAYGQCG